MAGLKHLMLKIFRPVPVFVACSVIVGIVLLISARTKQVKELAQEKPSPTRSFDQLTFRGIAIFDGTTADGAPFAEHFYKSSDCVSVSHEIIFFKSVARAEKEFENRRRKATTVVEHGVHWEDKAQAGQRVVMEFVGYTQEKAFAQIIWTSDSTFHSLVAPSLHYVIEFEKSLRSKDARITRSNFDLRNVTFTIKRSFKGKTEQGTDYSENEIASSDCEILSTRIEYFDSPIQAHERFAKEIKQAINVIEQGPKTNGLGQPVGERAVAALRAGASDESLDQSIVIWTDGSQVHSIKGRFNHVLAFEKRNQ